MRTLATIILFALVFTCPALGQEAGEITVSATLHDSGGSFVSFSSTGKMIVTAGGDRARIWNSITGAPVTEPLVHPEPVVAVEFSPDESRLMTVSGKLVRLWDVSAGKVALTIPHPEEVTSADLSDDSSLVLTGCKDGLTRMLDAHTGHEKFTKKHPGAVLLVHFSRDAHCALTVCEDASAKPESCRFTAHVWDTHNGTERTQKCVDWPDDVRTMTPRTAVLSPNGRAMATAHNPTPPSVGVVDFRENDLIALMDLTGMSSPAPIGAARSLTFSRDGKMLATCCAAGVAIWKLDADNSLVASFAEGGPVYEAVFSPDGTRLLIATDDSDAGLWDVNSRRQLLYLHDPPALAATVLEQSRQMARRWGPPAIAMSHDGRHIAAGFPETGETVIWTVSPRARD